MAGLLFIVFLAITISCVAKSIEEWKSDHGDIDAFWVYFMAAYFFCVLSIFFFILAFVL